jgi:Protein of unknown function (DUF2950)
MQQKMISPETAYPTVYRDSGVITFIVNQDDIVYEKEPGQEHRFTLQKTLRSATLIPLGDAPK